MRRVRKGIVNGNRDKLGQYYTHSTIAIVIPALRIRGAQNHLFHVAQRTGKKIQRLLFFRNATIRAYLNSTYPSIRDNSLHLPNRDLEVKNNIPFVSSPLDKRNSIKVANDAVSTNHSRNMRTECVEPALTNASFCIHK